MNASWPSLIISTRRWPSRSSGLTPAGLYKFKYGKDFSQRVLDASIYQEVWRYCRGRSRRVGAKAVFHKYTLPRHLWTPGYFNLGLVVGQQVVRLPRLSCIPRKPLKLSYPPHPYLLNNRAYVLPYTGTSDERWWDRHVWTGQEGNRKGQKRLAVEVLARDVVCRVCGEQPATETHHDPPWQASPKHDPKRANGVCSSCHRQNLHGVVKSNGELR